VDDAPYTDDLDLDAVNTRDELAELLWTVHVRAGKPSLRTLEKRTRRTASPLSKTAASEMLRGLRFPRKDAMVAFLTVCRVKADNMEVWRRAWERVAVREEALARPRAARTASGPGNAFLAEQHTSLVAGEAGNKERAERARGDRITAATSSSADPAGEGKLREQAREPSPGASAVSPAELRVFAAELTRTLHKRGKTIEQAAVELAVPPAEVTRWAAGDDLPSESQARSLDEYLTARGAIQNLVTDLRSWPDRSGPRLVSVPVPSPAAPTLLQTFQNVARALRGCLVRDVGGKATGWPPDLRELPGEAAAASTAYGIRTMLLLEDGLAADLIPLIESLSKMARPDGGFSSHGQSEPRPEATAAVLNALRRIAAAEDVGAHMAQMERGLGDFEKYRPFILTMMLETSLLIDPGTSLVKALIDSLLAARRPYGDVLLWPEKAEPLLITPAPSVAHTARAVRVLASVRAIRPSSQVQEALEQAVVWLIEQRNLHNAYEVTERPVKDGLELVHIRHFTAAWVVKALVSAGVSAAHPAVSNAVAQIWDSYRDTAVLWAWDNGDLPIWMTFDAIEALHLTSRAVSARPTWSPPS
jgi:hypothetical protein